MAPDFDKQCELAVDASDNIIVAALLQTDKDFVDNPVC